MGFIEFNLDNLSDLLLYVLFNYGHTLIIFLTSSYHILIFIFLNSFSFLFMIILKISVIKNKNESTQIYYSERNRFIKANQYLL